MDSTNEPDGANGREEDERDDTLSGGPAGETPEARRRSEQERYAPEDLVRRIDADDYDDYGEYEEPQAHEDEPLQRELAQFAFVREEEEREVRLSFRDVPADGVVKAFRDAGATLISIMGERAPSRFQVPSSQFQVPSYFNSAQNLEPGTGNLEGAEEEQPVKSRRRRRRREESAEASGGMSAVQSRPYMHSGELTIRYFFALRETIYTVNIASTTGIVESVASIYPSALQSEREVQSRVAVLFRG